MRRLTLPLTEATAAAIDSVRGQQARVDFIRQAIEREIKRRKSKAPRRATRPQ